MQLSKPPLRRMRTFTKQKLGADDNKSMINECRNEEASSIQASGEQLFVFK